MRAITSPIAKELLHEIKATPEEYLPALLEIVRGFRHGIQLKSADECLRQGLKEALSGETLPVSELWKGLDDH
jgi:hypothetical protein